MSCTEIRPDLIDYHFGAAGDRREAIEEHLLGCRDCLRDFLAIKREIETASLAEAPSADARDRLRRAVAVEVGAAIRPWRWWERPAAFAAAAASVLAAIKFVQVVSTAPF